MFSVDVRPAAQAYVLVRRGELDLHSAVQLQDAADTALTGPHPPALVVIDCAALNFCDFSGICGLIRVLPRLSAYGGVLRLGAVPGSIARVFELTGLDQVIAVFATAQEALAAGDGAREPSTGDTPPRRMRRVRGDRAMTRVPDQQALRTIASGPARADESGAEQDLGD
ncbi:STAS domain-containing protein [Streptomyces sp. NBC_00467]|uniref:STAS domain-containing protein n=1 Tax=Streptomyces sp. NBC_00467 TaxID=2975752 RepID=UPI002E195645